MPALGLRRWVGLTKLPEVQRVWVVTRQSTADPELEIEPLGPDLTVTVYEGFQDSLSVSRNSLLSYSKSLPVSLSLSLSISLFQLLSVSLRFSLSLPRALSASPNLSQPVYEFLLVFLRITQSLSVSLSLCQFLSISLSLSHGKRIGVYGMEMDVGAIPGHLAQNRRHKAS